MKFNIETFKKELLEIVALYGPKPALISADAVDAAAASDEEKPSTRLERLLACVPDAEINEALKAVLFYNDKKTRIILSDVILEKGSQEVRDQLLYIERRLIEKKHLPNVLEWMSQDIDALECNPAFAGHNYQEGAAAAYRTAVLTGDISVIKRRRIALQAEQGADQQLQNQQQCKQGENQQPQGEQPQRDEVIREGGNPLKKNVNWRQHFNDHGRKYMWALGAAVFVFLILALVAFPPLGVVIPVISAWGPVVAAAAWISAGAGNIIAGIVGCAAAGIALAYIDRVLGLLGFVIGYVMASQLFTYPAVFLYWVATKAVEKFELAWGRMTQKFEMDAPAEDDQQRHQDDSPSRQRQSQGQGPSIWVRSLVRVTGFLGVVFFGLVSAIALPLMSLLYGIALLGTRILDLPRVHIAAVYLRESFLIRLLLQPMQTIRGLFPKAEMGQPRDIESYGQTSSIWPVRFTRYAAWSAEGSALQQQREADSSEHQQVVGRRATLSDVLEDVGGNIGAMMKSTSISTGFFKQRNHVRDAIAKGAGFELPPEITCPSPALGMSGDGDWI